MPAYDHHFSPPAPVADVVVMDPVSGLPSQTLRGKLDSAADLTVIPQRIIAALGLTPRGHAWTRAFDGTYARRQVFYVRLRVESFEVPSVRCVAADRATVLVGRNVLNRFIILLDGSQLTFEMREP